MLRYRFWHCILLGCQIQKLGYSCNINMSGTGLAVVAVHTAPDHVDRITAAENMDIAALFIGHIVVFYRLQHFFHGVAADNHNFYAVAVQTILNTLRNRHSPPLPFHQRR